MRQLIQARLWLTVYQLPPYAPELNPVGRVVPPEEIPGQPHQAGHRPAGRGGEDPAQTDAVPAWAH